MKKEIKVLTNNQTWQVVDLPPGKKAIMQGTIGCKRDITKDMALTTKRRFLLRSLRGLISLAASRNCALYQLDVNNEFLHGTLQEEFYMPVPEGMSNPHKKVCHLIKYI